MPAPGDETGSATHAPRTPISITTVNVGLRARMVDLLLREREKPTARGSPAQPVSRFAPPEARANQCNIPRASTLLSLSRIYRWPIAPSSLSRAAPRATRFLHPVVRYGFQGRCASHSADVHPLDHVPRYMVYHLACPSPSGRSPRRPT